MSFAVCRMDKMKAHALKGIQFHNQRERESRTNFDIDESKTKLNYDLANQEKIDYNKRVKEIIESQKTGERKIRKDAVLVNSWMITSDSSFFDKLKPKEERRFFEEAYDFFSERYGKQ
ncbi:MobV family relaxase, partial [Xanthomonas citri pv. citri]